MHFVGIRSPGNIFVSFRSLCDELMMSDEHCAAIAKAKSSVTGRAPAIASLASRQRVPTGILLADGAAEMALISLV